MGHHKATRIAVDVGKAAAWALGIIGLFTNFMLVLVAVFVWFAANAEAKRLDAHGGWPYETYEPAYVSHHGGARIDAPWWAWQREEDLLRERRRAVSYPPGGPRATEPGWQRVDLGPRRIIIFGRPFWVR